MLIRKIRPGDDAEVAQIIRVVMAEFNATGHGFTIEDAEVDAMYDAYAGGRAVFYVLQEKNELVGCGGIAQLQGGGDQVCELKKMYFYERARGKGLGKLLAEMLIVDARRFGYAKMYIETLKQMKAACQLYQSLGFQLRDSCLGNTGHSGCDAFYALDLEPQEIDPSLLA